MTMSAENRSAGGLVTAAPADASDREIVLTRIVRAPRDLVFRAWTEPEHVVRWWGPDGFTTTTGAIDVRPGGSWRFVMHGPDGVDYPNAIEYLEVSRPDRLVYRHRGEEGHEGVQFLTTVTFADRDGATEVTLRMVFDTAERRDRVVEQYGAIEGGEQHLDRLAAYAPTIGPAGGFAHALALTSDREFVVTRTFDAPRRLVFEAWTRPEHVRRWWGCGAMEVAVCELDVRPGGGWRIVLRGPDGLEYRFRGVYREVDPPGRLVFTECFDDPSIGCPEWLTTMDFAERDGRTTLTVAFLHATPEGRDGHLGSGFEAGMAETFDRLAELLATLA